MKFSKSKKSLCAFLSAVTALNCMPACIQTYAVNDSVQKYEFENGSTDGGKIYTETWKGNTQENGSGEDFDLTFGLMHTVEKSAEILVKMLSMSPTKLQTIQPDDFRHLAKDFNVTLPEQFLYDKIK